MQFEVSERIDTSAERKDVMNLALAQFRKIAETVVIENDQIVAKGVEATFGSINRADRTVVDCKKLPSGWLLTAEVAYRPSVAFWIILILMLFTYIGWLIPIAFYLIQRNTVKSGVAAALSRVSNEMRDAPTAMAAVPQSSSIDELAKLADLKERGFITDEEFEAKKQQLLAQ
jgi:hypothetical protein